MISFWTERDQTNCFTRKSPLTFFTNFFKKNKYKLGKCSEVNNRSIKNKRVPKILSVSVMDMRMTSPCLLSPALSTLTLTPGRTRDIDQDMEALRLSRQDNPFLQVLASRESLAESLFESESDDMNLMSQEFPNEADIDPLSLPEIHEHMIRSPPPTNWPKSPYFKVFTFPNLSQTDAFQQTGDSPTPNDVQAERIMFSHELKVQPETDSKFNDIGYSTIHSTHSCRTTAIQKPHQRSSSECRDRTGNLFPLVRPKPIRSLSDVRRLQGNVVIREHTTPESEKRHEFPSPVTVPLLSKKCS